MKFSPEYEAQLLAGASHVGPTTKLPSDIGCRAVGPYHSDRCLGGRIQSPNAQFTRECTMCKGTGKAPPAQPKKPHKSTTIAPVVWKAFGIPQPVAEFRFAPPRRWRFDYAWPDHGKVSLEIDGAPWTGGRHTRGKGFIKDQEKRNAAILAGWRCFHCVPVDVKSGAIFATIREALND